MRNIILLSVLGLSFILSACSCPVCEITENRYPKTFKLMGVPENMKERVDSYIAARSGEDFFLKNVKLNETASYFDSVKYYWVYDIAIEGKEWASGKIELFTDSLGNVDPLMEVSGIPECASNPNSCDYTITPTKAKELAQKEGLKAGVKEWSVKFIWNPKYKNYVWQVLSTLEESQGSHGFRGSGQELILDASTGAKLEMNEWKVR
ncbi:MAG: hypothetical protein HBSAPP04_07080 [Ignavibacteriaceae bacterium]|nr:MAG: hypothetical protein HBSAPP04_07080 [Ignavibacteriaceae bacterium]